MTPQAMWPYICPNSPPDVVVHALETVRPETCQTGEVIRRICVVGNTASGKSHLAGRLAAQLGLPLTHLDQVYWQAGWSHVSRTEFLAAQRDLIAEPGWVIDGCFSEFGLRQRFEAADVVVFLDLPIGGCLRRAAQRRGDQRADLPAGADDARMGLGLMLAFLAEMVLFPLLDRPRILQAVRQSGVRLFRMRTWSDEEDLVVKLTERVV